MSLHMAVSLFSAQETSSVASQENKVLPGLRELMELPAPRGLLVLPGLRAPRGLKVTEVLRDLPDLKATKDLKDQRVFMVGKVIKVGFAHPIHFLRETSTRHLNSFPSGDRCYGIIWLVLGFNVRAYKRVSGYFLSRASFVFCLLLHPPGEPH